MTPSRLIRGRLIGFTVAATSSVLLVAGCRSGGEDSAASSGDGSRIASLESPGTPAQPSGEAGTAPGKGPKKAPLTDEQRTAAVNSCRTKKAQEAGIETKVSAVDSHDAGYVVPTHDLGPMGENMDGTFEGSPLVKKWWGEIVVPCFKDVEGPEIPGDDGRTELLAEMKKQYECMNKAGLEDLHEPTLDNTTIFTPDGTSKYIGGKAVDPHTMSILRKCGFEG
ncbi:hypothetical protein [Streptomyces sp. NPDC051569]|uniref:hypothetical protein n=1 Tax=Streptomyces sp. NPDC051569 TaxID=3365661 RepID=UPI00379144EB